MLSHKASRARICALALCIVICLPSLALAQYLSLAPLEENFAGSSTPVEFRDACFNINLWASVKAHTDYLGEADWEDVLRRPADLFCKHERRGNQPASGSASAQELVYNCAGVFR
jgi:hypothetical protein